MLLDKIKNSFSGWLTIQNTNENRPTLNTSIINRKAIKGIGSSYKTIDLHTLQNNDNIIVGSIKITLKSVKDTADNKEKMMEILTTLEKVVALMGNDETYNAVMEIVNKTDFSEIITIPPKKEKNVTVSEPAKPIEAESTLF